MKPVHTKKNDTCEKQILKNIKHQIKQKNNAFHASMVTEIKSAYTHNVKQLNKAINEQKKILEQRYTIAMKKLEEQHSTNTDCVLELKQQLYDLSAKLNDQEKISSRFTQEMCRIKKRCSEQLSEGKSILDHIMKDHQTLLKKERNRLEVKVKKDGGIKRLKIREAFSGY